MRLHATDPADRRRISSYRRDGIVIDGERYETSLLVSSSGVEQFPDATDLGTLVAATEPLLADAVVQVLLLGTGESYDRAPADFAERMAARGIGVESMSTAAACRTYNVLASEGRKVWAVLLVGS